MTTFGLAGENSLIQKTQSLFVVRCRKHQLLPHIKSQKRHSFFIFHAILNFLVYDMAKAFKNINVYFYK